MQTPSFRIRTRITYSIFNDDNSYSKHASTIYARESLYIITINCFKYPLRFLEHIPTYIRTISGGFENTDHNLCRGIRFSIEKEYSAYDTKLHLLVRVQFWGSWE